MSNSNRTPEKVAAFCAALAETCNVGKACAAVGMGRTTAYAWRDDEPEFAALWDRAMKVGVTALEDEAHRRAFDGVADPLTHQGQFTYQYEVARDEQDEIIHNEDGTPKMIIARDSRGEPKIATIRKYSDTLAIFLLKAHAPDKYRERQHIEHAGQVDIVNVLNAARTRVGD